jgi:hypothetical protein
MSLLVNHLLEKRKQAMRTNDEETITQFTPNRLKLARCGYTLRVTSQASYSPEYITPTQKKS